MEIFLAWVIFSVLVGAYASSKKTWGGFFGGLFISLLFSPIIGFIVVTVSSPSEAGLARSGQKKCPYCAEWVKGEAIVCKHCGKDLSDAKKGPTGS
jgi:CDP-diglyceride synthetase